jgi:dipeptidyl aminopeptidase/acylaminoacyl peptidase
MKLHRSAWALAAIASIASARPFSPNDLVTLARISDPQASPDGRHVLYVQRETDMDADRGRTSLWQVDLPNGTPRRLTTAIGNASQPRWSADGRAIFFLSTRSDSSQVWRLPADGGEASQVTTLDVDVNAFALAPRGDRLVVSLDVFLDCADLACTKQRLDERADRPSKGRLYDHLFVRHWDTWADGRRSVLHSLPLDASGRVSGPLVALSRAVDGDVPGKPFGGSEDFAVTRDGRGVIFSARVAGTTEPWSTNFDLFRVAIDGSSAPENLTAKNPAWDAQPVLSADGRWLAYLAMTRPGYESDRFHIVLRELATGNERVVASDWDRSVASLAFAPSGRALFATADSVGNHPLYRIDLPTGRVTEVVGAGYVSGFTFAGDRIVLARDDLAAPADLYMVGDNGANLRKLTSVNAARLADVEMGTFEQFTFAGAGGETVHGYVVAPAGRDPARKYPVAYLIHGGPQGSFQNQFHYRWNAQTYAGAGYAAAMVDFHGSTGYGQAFTDSIRDDWGGKPLEDLKRGLAAAVEKYPWLDGDRVCALGGSYGGYMINWIAGQWSDRFRCLVDHDGVFDHRQMYYATEELWFPEWDHRGTEYDNPAGYAKDNPVDHVAAWRTPILVIHGALDYRVPETQGLATFTAAQRRGIPSEFLYFPDENHWVLKPHNSLRWHDTVNRWLDRWLKAP